MAKDYRHYRVLAEQLNKYVDQDVKDAILVGMDTINSSSKPEIKSRWARELMYRMDSLLDPDTCIKVREGCACVVSNENSNYARNFRKLRKLFLDDDEYIDAVIKYLNATAPLRRCGEVTRDGDKIFSVIAHGRCGCPVLHNGLSAPISVTWCHCSKGSLLSVYKQVFPSKICEMEIIRTIATGSEDCCFVTTYR